MNSSMAHVLLRLAGVLFLPIMVFLISCNFNSNNAEIPSLPLIELAFEEQIVNTGVMPVTFRGDENVSFANGVFGSCLNLSYDAMFRKPLIISKNPDLSLNDYPGITLLFWVKMAANDPNNYTIISQLENKEEFGTAGWQISASQCGSWKWWLSDGINTVTYNPTSQRQPINDSKWHLVGFSLNFQTKEARLYYDGSNVAVFCLQELDLSLTDNSFFIGSDQGAANPVKETFNGKIDELTLWGRVLSENHIDALYGLHHPLKSSGKKSKLDSITVMTWNIWGGGVRDGKHVGVKRVADIIKSSGADIVTLQETFGSGPMIADALGFYYYQRSEGISVLSRFPFGATYNVYRSRTAGAVTIELPKNNQIIISPISLSYIPNLGPYIMSGNAEPDTIIAREMETRGSEIRFIVWEMQALLNNNQNVPIIMAGDFNSGSHLDWTAANAHNRFGLEVNYPVSRILETSGFIDAYRIVFPDEVLNPGFTWSPRFREVLHDRINYIYYSGTFLKPSWANVIDDYPYGFPSDHAAVVTSFKWE